MDPSPPGVTLAGVAASSAERSGWAAKCCSARARPPASGSEPALSGVAGVAAARSLAAVYWCGVVGRGEMRGVQDKANANVVTARVVSVLLRAETGDAPTTQESST